MLFDRLTLQPHCHITYILITCEHFALEVYVLIACIPETQIMTPLQAAYIADSSCIITACGTNGIVMA